MLTHDVKVSAAECAECKCLAHPWAAAQHRRACEHALYAAAVAAWGPSAIADALDHAGYDCDCQRMDELADALRAQLEAKK